MYEVTIAIGKHERVIRSGIRRENGAINERDIAVDSAIANARKHCEGDPDARVIVGPIDTDPNAVVVVYHDPIATIYTTVTYRRVTRPADDDLLDALTASVIAYTGASL